MCRGGIDVDGPTIVQGQALTRQVLYGGGVCISVV